MKVLLTSLFLVHECSGTNSSSNESSADNETTTTTTPAGNETGNATTTTAAPVRGGLGSCNMNHTTAMALLAEGNLSMAADLGADCGGCLTFGDEDVCPCMASDICVLGGCALETEGCVAPRVGLGSCNLTHIDDMEALGNEDYSVIGAMGDCGLCMTTGDPSMCPCLGPALCASAGCVTDGDHCKEPRAYAGSCGLGDATPLKAIAEGNESAAASLSTNCTMCFGAMAQEGDDDMCPCMSADLCAAADGCMVSGDSCAEERVHPHQGSCGLAQAGALSLLKGGDSSQLSNLGTECGSCILHDTENVCPCMDKALCETAGCEVEGDKCVAPSPQRPHTGSCGFAYAGPLTLLKDGDTSQLANLGEECGPCILADTTDPCPCMDSSLCPMAGCQAGPEGGCMSIPMPDTTTTTGPPEKEEPSEVPQCFEGCMAACGFVGGPKTDQTTCGCLAKCIKDTTCAGDDLKWVTENAKPFVDGGCGYVPVSKVTVSAVTKFAAPLDEAAQTSVKKVFCDKVQAAMEAEYEDCEDCAVLCTITEVTRRRRLLAEVSYELTAEVTVPSSEDDASATDTFGATFQEEIETTMTTDPAVVEANGGVAPEVTVKPVTVVKITTTTAPATTAKPSSTTDSIEFSSAATVSCLAAVLAPLLML